MVTSSPSTRPRTPGRSPPPGDASTPPLPLIDPNTQQPPPRRTSFSFLRRGKSVERLTSKRSVSGGKISKKERREMELQQQLQTPALPAQAPKIPDLASPGQLQTFGGEDASVDNNGTRAQRGGAYYTGRARPTTSMDTTRSVTPYGVPLPPVPGTKNGEYVDPYSRTESMTHRGRYSYASSAVSTINSPRRVRRRKDPTPFNILVVGTPSSGKTSFIEFLRTSLALPARKQRPQHRHDDDTSPTPGSSRFFPGFVSHYVETEMDDGERIGLTLWDSDSLDKNIIDLQLREMSSFLESKFEDTLSEEMKVVRSPGVRDTHIHCVFFVLDPLRLETNIAAAQKAAAVTTNGALANGKSHLPTPSLSVLSGLDEDLDLQVLRTLQGKTTVVPIISKADTITTAHMGQLKRAVWESLKQANLDPLEALGLDDGDDEDLDSDIVPDSPVLGRKHDSKRLDERDEDALLHVDSQASPTSHLDSASSSSDSETATAAATARHPPSHSRASSSTFPPPLSSPQPVATPTDPADTTIPYLPLSIISPEPGSNPNGPVGRQFPWGFADPYNVEHCDFVRLKEAVFREWRGELRQASRELWYERWRTSRLNGSQGRRGAGIGRAR